MAKYRKKAVVIEAVKWDGNNPMDIQSFLKPLERMGQKAYRDKELFMIPTLEGLMAASKGDYIIKGVKGEYYPCKPDIFELTYQADESQALNFGQAIEALKAGKKVARKGWNGKGMFLWLKPGIEIKSEWCKDPLLKQLADDNGGSITGLGTICMFTRDSSGRKAILTGWLASQSDMLLEDWEII